MIKYFLKNIQDICQEQTKYTMRHEKTTRYYIENGHYQLNYYHNTNNGHIRCCFLCMWLNGRYAHDFYNYNESKSKNPIKIIIQSDLVRDGPCSFCIILTCSLLHFKNTLFSMPMTHVSSKGFLKVWLLLLKYS